MIKLLCVDCDGVLTDGIYSMCEHGSIHKGFYSRDFHGMQELYETGVEVAIVSYSGDPVVNEQCARAAKYAMVHTKIRDKRKFVYDEFVGGSMTYAWKEIAFIGDDNVDLELLRSVGLAACPNDSHESIMNMIADRKDGHRMHADGGRGAVREFADYIIALNEAEKKNAN